MFCIAVMRQALPYTMAGVVYQDRKFIDHPSYFPFMHDSMVVKGPGHRRAESSFSRGVVTSDNTATQLP